MAESHHDERLDFWATWLERSSLVCLLATFAAVILSFSLRAEYPETLKILVMSTGSAVAVLTIFLTDDAYVRLLKLRFYLLPFCIFGGILIFSRLWSEFPFLVWAEIPGLLSVGLFMLAIVVQPRSDRVVRYFSITIVFLVPLVGAYGFVQKVSYDPVIWLEHGDRIFSTFGNPNIFSSFLLFSVPLCVMVVFSRSALWFKISAIASLAISMTMLIWAGSRGAWLIFIFLVPMLLIYLFRHGHRKKGIHLILGIIILTCLVPIVFPPQVQQVRDRFTSLFDRHGPSIQGRLMMYASAFRAIQDKPLQGWGMGSVPAVFPLYHNPELYDIEPFNQLRSVKHIHSEYIEVAIEVGLIGLLALIVCCISVIRAFRHRQIGRHSAPLLTAYFIGLGVLATQASFSVSSRFMTTKILICTACALVLSGVLSGPVRSNARQESGGRRLPTVKTIIYLILCCISLFSMHNVFNNYRASCLLKQAKTMVAQKKYTGAQQVLLEAQNREPYSAEIFQNLGAVLTSMGDTRSAIASFEHVLLLNPHHSHTHYNLALLMLQRGHYDRALELLVQAERWRPRSWLIEELFGDAYARQGRIDEAIEHYNRAIELAPSESNRLDDVIVNLLSRVDAPID